MKIAIGTCLFTEGNVDVDTGHVAKIRLINQRSFFSFGFVNLVGEIVFI